MLSDLIQSITIWIGGAVTWGGSSGILLVALFENLFPPTPSEWLYPLAGKMAFDGTITLIEVIVAGVLGSLIGATIWYALGYRLGEARTRQFVEKYGTLTLWRFRLTWAKASDFDTALDLFKRRGGVIVFVARIMPLVHGIVSVPAGVAKMPLASFYFYTVLGAFAWIAPLSLFGYFLGSQWENILTWLDLYQNVWYALIALAIGYYAFRKWRG